MNDPGVIIGDQHYRVGMPARSRRVEERSQGQKFWCHFCGGPGTTKHHLVPRSVVDRCPQYRIWGTIRLCRPCHDEVHRLFGPLELGLKWNDPVNLQLEFYRRRNRLVS